MRNSLGTASKFPGVNRSLNAAALRGLTHVSKNGREGQQDMQMSRLLMPPLVHCHLAASSEPVLVVALDVIHVA